MTERYGDLVSASFRRRDHVRRHPTLHGIDFLEVGPPPGEPDQRVLEVHFIPKPLPGGDDSLAALLQSFVDRPQGVTIEGGVRRRHLRVVKVQRVEKRLVVKVDEPGDFSTYVLRLDDPAGRLDAQRTAVPFTFKAACPTRFDCKPHDLCAEPEGPSPPIDYLAKDYASFRQGLLDLLPTLDPRWVERHEASLGMALVDVVAYVGDRLSYYQDAVANEAYLETARRRISVRRHARLIDYTMHDGASARVFLHVEARVPLGGLPAAPWEVPAGTLVLTRLETPTVPPPHPTVFTGDVPDKVVAGAAAAFETMQALTLHVELNRLRIHAFGEDEACLPRGATSAHLRGKHAARLPAGSFLLFEERTGVREDNAETADPLHRQVVRIVESVDMDDPVPPPDADEGSGVTFVRWAEEDALTFSACVRTRDAKGGTLEDVTVARGNVVPAAHGVTFRGEVHPGPLTPPSETQRRAHRVILRKGPLAWWPRLEEGEPAAALFAKGPEEARAQVGPLRVEGVPGDWKALPHLLESHPFDASFAVEVDDAGRAHLRFGLSGHGMPAPDGKAITVTYRVGMGAAGNVGAGSLVHLWSQTPLPFVASVRNPLGAQGGVEREPIERVKRIAPAMLAAGLHRAVTELDYARAAELHPGVSKAMATFRRSRTWTTAFLTVDRKGGAEVDEAFRAELRAHVGRYALAGYDVEVQAPVHVPLEIEVEVCVARDRFRADVERELLEVVSARTRAGGQKGFFHPDLWTFGQPLHLSRLYAALESVPGVDAAKVTKVKRFWEGEGAELSEGYVTAGRLEILQVENDPSHPQRGSIRFHMRGGRG